MYYYSAYTSSSMCVLSYNPFITQDKTITWEINFIVYGRGKLFTIHTLILAVPTHILKPLKSKSLFRVISLLKLANVIIQNRSYFERRTNILPAFVTLIQWTFPMLNRCLAPGVNSLNLSFVHIT